jgi:hypothetical protein
LILLLIDVFDTEERLTLLNGELGEHRTRPKDLTVMTDVATINLGKNSQVFEATIDHLVPRPHPCLHRQLLGRGNVVEWALDLVGVPTIPIVGLNALVLREVLGEDGGEDLDVRPLPSWVWTLNPDKVPGFDVNAQLVPQGGLAGVLMGAEGVSFLRLPLLEDAEVSSINGHQAVVAFIIVEPTIEVDLWFREGGRKQQGDGEMAMEMSEVARRGKYNRVIGR